MKCIKCGAEIKSEYKICPYCGSSLQLVPDYSVYDEDNINIIVENVNDTPRKPELTKEQREARAAAKQKAAEAAKKRKMQLTIAIVTISCMLLVVVGVIAKVMIDNNKNNSFSHQMKEADSAMFKGDIDTAEKFYLRALALEPGNIEVRLELADLYIDKKDTKEAEMYLKEVIAKDAENYEAYRMLYDIYSEAGNTDAILKLMDGVTNSKILSIFTNYSVDAPLLSTKGGTYNEDVKVSISAKKGVEIYYTLDGTDPKKDGIKYKSTIEITGAGMHTLRVVTKNEKGVFSDVVMETFIIEYKAPEDPIVNPYGGTFTEKTYVYITVPSGCSAYYTWDRTDPTAESAKYVSAILIPEGRNMLSVIIIDDKTGLTSEIYRGMYEYTPAEAEDSE